MNYKKCEKYIKLYGSALRHCPDELKSKIEHFIRSAPKEESDSIKRLLQETREIEKTLSSFAPPDIRKNFVKKVLESSHEKYHNDYLILLLRNKLPVFIAFTSFFLGFYFGVQDLFIFQGLDGELAPVFSGSDEGLL